MSTTLAQRFVSRDEITQALADGQLHDMLEGSGLKARNCFAGSADVQGFLGCDITVHGKGATLPKGVRIALENHMNRQIVQRGMPTSFYVNVSEHQAFDCGAGVGCWNDLRNNDGGHRAIALGETSGVITNRSWKKPDLRLAGFDLEKNRIVYDYHGEFQVG